MNNNFKQGIIFEHKQNKKYVPSINISNHNRIGEVNYNTCGGKMTIIEYINARKMTVLIESTLITGDKAYYIKENVPYDRFLKGIVKSPFDPSVYGIGYLGIGPYSIDIHRRHYDSWNSMLGRCYSEKYHAKKPSYVECIVDPIFHNFQNFALWYDYNYYEIEGETIQLDKDILYPGNKVYSPITCVFVPAHINSLFAYQQSTHNDELPIGSRIRNNKYEVRCYIDGERKIIGRFENKEDAYMAYKNAKEKEIKRVANLYKDKIPLKLYNAMMNYTVI